MTTSHSRPQSAAEAEREVAQTRGELASSIEELQERLQPQVLVDRALTYLKGDGKTYGDALLREAQANPVAALMAGAGIAWLLVSASRRASNRPDAYRQADDPYGAGRMAYRDPQVRASAPPAAHRTGPGADTDPVTAPATATPSSPASMDREARATGAAQAGAKLGVATGNLKD